jgi:hypothetical protein
MYRIQQKMKEISAYMREKSTYSVAEMADTAVI